MERYRDLNRDSGIHTFEIGSDFMVIEFKGGSTYLYTYQTASRGNIEQMKTLAIGGKGLGTFINKYVREKYTKRLR